LSANAAQITAGVRVVALDETGSTNADAMARALAGEPLPFWLIADRQTAGKGRSGRSWVCVPGNFQASFAVKVHCATEQAAQLSLVAGVAVIEAIKSLAPQQGRDNLYLKWPNDILVKDAKCGGILVETARERTGGGLIAVIGIGLNLVSHPEIADRKVTHLTDDGDPATQRTYLTAVAASMQTVLEIWNDGAGFAQIVARWLEAASPLGTGMAIHTGAAHVEGLFAGLGDDGALLLKNTSGRIERFTFGDVELLATAGPKAG
jgi:BirA family transcriptional regulator, biotin operon repressor / biotin---[acetyl-CoA-carboxylase] ligase